MEARAAEMKIGYPLGSACKPKCSDNGRVSRRAPCSTFPHMARMNESRQPRGWIYISSVAFLTDYLY